ncbi:gamma-interferon-inducible lysosomal thiol reductase-like [Battus philenor]|uniref:gamma-interferon-inducible lysosomal thiol reductase-like n=1 Tax=Battus philenor TaxID=42288 RepID=UPI0035D0DA9B
MSFLINILICFAIPKIGFARVQNMYIVTSNNWDEFEQAVELFEQDMELLDKVYIDDNKVTIQVYYECLCPGCIQFDTGAFASTVRKLYEHLDIYTYPYGNAKTFIHDGKYQFKCQHGPKECYGNKLHACAIDLLNNETQALLFNSCMMTPRNNSRGSDDESADRCGEKQDIDVTTIKECAKGDRGSQLLKHYGDESKKAHFKYVPYILINGNLNNGGNFFRDVCAAFQNPPPPCR